MTNRGKRSKTLSEVKLVENINKNLQSFLEISPEQKSKTKHHFKVQICEHLGISHLTGKKVKIDNNKLTAIQEH